ncbi:hypothetical protein FS837_001325 [Tulasnella sp. UAMH 9824]|nr:hypothetical protein FS837_001325 [Tulasnella sp. UAMH 9824]
MESDDHYENTDMVFEGIDGAEAETFIRSVQRTSRAQGRTRDNEWITDLVSTCMAGEALRWYVELDEDTQNDWKLLRKAILRQYPSPTQPSAPSSSLPTIPIPAAAATPPNSFHSIQLAQTSKATYRIRLYFANRKSEFFLSTDHTGQVCLTKNVARAFNVHKTPGNELRLIDNGLETQRMICRIWYFRAPNGQSPSGAMDCALLFVSDSRGNNPPTRTFTGATQVANWALGKDGWLQSFSYINQTKYQHQYQAAAGRTEGDPTRAYMLPGLQHWQIESDWIFTMKLEPV